MKRLIDDPEIAGELRSEMRRYASEQAQVDLKSAYASLEESLQLAAAGTSAPQARFSGGAWAGLSGATKLLIVAAIGGTTALGVHTLRSGEYAAQVSSAPAELVRIAPAPANTDSPSSATRSPTVAESSSTSAPHAQRAAGFTPLPTTPETTASDGAPHPQPEAAQAATPRAGRSRSSSSSASRREIAQVARIKALLEQDPAAARRLIRAAQREFPSGLLVEEREGLDVIALFALDESERARKNAERFIDHYPQSPLRPKLERLIADARE